jgi:hypothetical protein
MRDNFDEQLKEAWNDFKGSSKNMSSIEANQVIDIVETARTTSVTDNLVDAVKIFVDPDNTITSEIHKIINRHNLVLVSEDHNSHHTELVFTTEEIAEENDIPQLEIP